MSHRTECNGLAVATELFELVNREIAPGAGVEPDGFWSAFAAIVSEFAPKNRDLLEKREAIQGRVNQWHLDHPGAEGTPSYRQFLEDIGYIVAEGDDFSIGTRNVDPEIATVPDIDSAAVTLVTASGKIAQISNSRRASYGYDQRIEVHGSTGMVRADNLHETTVQLATSAGYHTTPLMNFFLERYMPAYRAEVQLFVDVVTNGAVLTATGDDGLRSLMLAEAAARSISEGRTISVDEI